MRFHRKFPARVRMLPVLGSALAFLTLMSGAPLCAQEKASEVANEKFGFAAPPSTQANRVYAVNRQTGEVSACQFDRPDNALVGVTRCFPRGEGAGPQPPGIYGLVPTHYAGETGIFRTNAESGEMSICYVRDMPRSAGPGAPAIVCTPPAR